MNFFEVVNANTSKKMGIAIASIASIITLYYIQAPSWQIMVVAVTAILTQGFLDLFKERGNKSQSGTFTGSAEERRED